MGGEVEKLEGRVMTSRVGEMDRMRSCNAFLEWDKEFWVLSIMASLPIAAVWRIVGEARMETRYPSSKEDSYASSGSIILD